ncbi:MAG TPA: acyltransferase [Verrucomicrobiae bacterium]|nr:acyltransferase [Verrucomicrobiae bacterium]
MKKLPSLNGWRMISITLVLLYHSSFTPGFPPQFLRLINGFDTGALGVRFFFVISGFLITFLLIQEQSKHGFINLKDFFLRRALRILPVYFAYLLALIFLTGFSQTPTDWLVNLTFTTDFHPTPYPTTHLWSLGVEEQFYLIWPCFLGAAVSHQGGVSKLLKILFMPLLVAPIVRMVGCEHAEPESLECLFQKGSFFARCDSLAYGSVAAVIFTKYRGQVDAFYTKNPRVSMGMGVTLLLTVPCLRFLHAPMIIQAGLSDSIQAIGFTLLLVQSILCPKHGPYRFLNWKWVAHLGILSYSIYIWQELFCTPDQPLFGFRGAWCVNFPGCIFTALFVAHGSYYLLEKPLLSLRAKFRPVLRE